jgi:hypothetical protein
MWIFLNDAFYSIVDYSNGAGPNLMVRARFKGDINRTFPEVEELHLPGRDYAYRASIPRERVAKAMHDAVMDINYSNFKDSVAEDWRHNTYADVWAVMYDEQTKQNKPTYDPLLTQ